MMNEKVKGPMLTLSDLYNDDVVYTSGLHIFPIRG